MTTLAWAERAQVPASMLNPSLIGLLIASAAAGYRKKSARDMPWELIFIVMPLVLHKPTRQELPGAISTHLVAWVGRHPQLCATLPYRAQSLRDPTLEGLRFALRHEWVQLSGADLTSKVSKFTSADLGDLRELLRKAEFVGRWLSFTPRTSTIYSLLGVTP